jgi:hypothetical protein
MTFEEDLAAQVAEEFDWVNVPVTVGGNPYSIRITQMGGLEWADEVDRHPARADVETDQHVYGFNLRSLTLAVLRPVVKDGQVVKQGCGELYDGDRKLDLTPEQWDRLLRSLDGGTVVRLGNAVFNLNEASRIEAILAAGKALADESASNSTSPANSESIPDGLMDGSPSDV